MQKTTIHKDSWRSGDNQSVGSSVLVVSRRLWPGNRTFLEMASMVVTWWILAFLRSDYFKLANPLVVIRWCCNYTDCAVSSLVIVVISIIYYIYDDFIRDILGCIPIQLQNT